jgi:hypothetical protein
MKTGEESDSKRPYALYEEKMYLEALEHIKKALP